MVRRFYSEWNPADLRRISTVDGFLFQDALGRRVRSIFPNAFPAPPFASAEVFRLTFRVFVIAVLLRRGGLEDGPTMQNDVVSTRRPQSRTRFQTHERMMVEKKRCLFR